MRWKIVEKFRDFGEDEKKFVDLIMNFCNLNERKTMENRDGRAEVNFNIHLRKAHNPIHFSVVPL